MTTQNAEQSSKSETSSDETAIIEKSRSEDKPSKSDGGEKQKIKVTGFKEGLAREMAKQEKTPAKTTKVAAHERTIAPREAARVSDSATSTDSAPATRSEPIAPPADMNASEKAQWDSLAPEAQRYLSRRYAETRSGVDRYVQKLQSEYGAKEQRVKNYLDVIGPEEEALTKYGMQGHEVVKRAILWAQEFQKDKNLAALQYLHAQGVDFNRLSELHQAHLQGRTLPSNVKPVDPNALREEIRQEFESEFQRRDQMVLAQTMSSAVEEFISTKPLLRDPGTAIQVQDAMVPIVAAFRAQDPTSAARNPKGLLERAYKIVVNDPDLPFATLNSKLSAKAEIEKKTSDAEKAQQASKSISGGPGGTPSRKFANRKDELRARLSGAI